MKGIHNLRNIIIVSTIGVLTLSLIVITFIFRSNSQQNTDQTTNVRASNLTYKRELDLVVDASQSLSPSASPFATIFPSILATVTASQSASLSATLTATPSPTVYFFIPTNTIVASDRATPTSIHSLPRTGWTQNVSIMFIAASVLMFLSFLF